MTNLRLVLTGIQAFVPETYDELTGEFTFPLHLLLPNGQETRPATTDKTKGEDRVIPSHHAFIQFLMSDLDSKSARRPDFRFFQGKYEFGVCIVDGEFLELPDFVRPSPGQKPQTVPESVTDFATVCKHARVSKRLLKTNPEEIGARMTIPVGVLKPNKYDPAPIPTLWEFRPAKEGKKATTQLNLGRRPCIEWPIPNQIGTFQITSKLLKGGRPCQPLSFVKQQGDVQILFANIPTDSLLKMRHTCQRVDADFELYYLLYAHKGHFHVPYLLTSPTIFAGHDGPDCGNILIRRA